MAMMIGDDAARARRYDLRPVRIRRTRQLHGDGRVIVAVGDQVRSDQVVARGQGKTRLVVVDFARTLGVKRAGSESYLRKSAGHVVQKGDLLASRWGLLGWRSRTVAAPCHGTVLPPIAGSGELVIAETRADDEAKALLLGTVISLVPKRGAVVEGVATRLEGLLGHGRLGHGPLVPIGRGPDHPIRVEDLAGGQSHDGQSDRTRGAILLGGSISVDAALHAEKSGVAGIAVGSIEPRVWEILVARPLQVPLLVLEAFGSAGLPGFAWDALKGQAGRPAILAGCGEHPEAGWPELIIPLGSATGPGAPEPIRLDVGTLARVSRGPESPLVGRVTRVSSRPIRLPNGRVDRWVEVESMSGQRVRVSAHAVEPVAAG